MDFVVPNRFSRCLQFGYFVVFLSSHSCSKNLQMPVACPAPKGHGFFHLVLATAGFSTPTVHRFGRNQTSGTGVFFAECWHGRRMMVAGEAEQRQLRHTFHVCVCSSAMLVLPPNNEIFHKHRTFVGLLPFKGEIWFKLPTLPLPHQNNGPAIIVRVLAVVAQGIHLLCNLRYSTCTNSTRKIEIP